MDETAAKPEMRNISWMAAWAGLACCLVSKESIRYTALWTFELKSPALMIAILAFIVAGFLGMALAWTKRKTALWKCGPLVFGLAFASFAGTAVHVLEEGGMLAPDWLSFLAKVAAEASLLLLVVYAQYLLQFSWSERLSVFVWGIIGAGAWQIVLIAVSVDLARWLVAIAALLSAGLLVVSRRSFAQRSPTVEAETADQHSSAKGARSSMALPKNKAASTESNQTGTALLAWPRLSLRDALLSPKSFSGYVATIFLVSIVLMGAYSQWRTQQDGQLVSMLVQASSGFGFMLTALVVSLLGRSVRDKSLLYVCQTIVLPVALGALYIGTAFQGPGVSLSVILFDAAYSAILFVIWLSPDVFDRNDSFIVVWAGFLAYKLGWFAGVLTTASLAHTTAWWLGNVVVVSAFLCLVVQCSAFVVGNLRPGNAQGQPQADSSGARASLEQVCGRLSERFGLTAREQDVLLLLAKGRTASYIARDLVVSEPTVRTHMSHIYRKMDVASHQQLLDTVEQATRQASGSEPGNNPGPTS